MPPNPSSALKARWLAVLQSLTGRPLLEKMRAAGRRDSSWRQLGKLLWLGLAGSPALIIALIAWQNWDTVLSTVRNMRYHQLGWAFAAYMVSISAAVLGWHLIMRDLAEQKNLRLNLKIYLYTLSARRLPGTIWYIAGRAIWYQRLGVPKRVSSLASGVEVVLQITTGLMVGAPALFIHLGVSVFSVLIFCLVELAGLSLLHPKILTWLFNRFGYQLEKESWQRRNILLWLGAAIAMWIGSGFSLYVVVTMLHPLDLSQAPLIISLWALTASISFITFFLPYNLGFTEFALSAMLSSVVPLPIALTAAIMLRIVLTAFDLMWLLGLLWENRTTFAR